MFDIKWIRDNAAAFDHGLARRGIDGAGAQALELDEARRACQARLQVDQAGRNAASREIGSVKAQGGDAGQLIAEMSALKEAIKAAEDEERRLGASLDELLAALPNLPRDDVPEGRDESANIEIRHRGEPPVFDFEAREHFDLGEALGEMDFEAAARMSGARFVVLTGRLARLERALGAFMLDLHVREFGYRETSAPLLVRDAAVFGTGQLPKFAADLFATTNGMWLIPTAEVPLANLAREQVLDAADLPLRHVALTQCFRSEAGAAGKDTRGMIRQHQFAKVELVSITLPDRAKAEHERMTACAEEVLRRLGLPYRVMLLCVGDMSFSARKTYDIEVWLPGQGRFREISSCSDCGDFQARRMGARFRPGDGKGTRHVHTLNGSALAVGRTLVAVLENYQRADGSIEVPRALVPYMDGLKAITPDG